MSAIGDLTNRPGHVLHLGIDPHSRFSTVLTGRRLGDQPASASPQTPSTARSSVSRVAWNLGDDPWWTLGGGTDAFGAGVGVSLEGGDELGHLLVALDAAE